MVHISSTHATKTAALMGLVDVVFASKEEIKITVNYHFARNAMLNITTA